MRRMSFSLTERQFLDGSKDVTRRLGWKFLKPGDHVLAVRKAMGLKKGEQQHILGPFEVLDVRREPLNAITDRECIREGFPKLRAPDFVTMFCKKMKVTYSTEVTRIEFRRLPLEKD